MVFKAKVVSVAEEKNDSGLRHKVQRSGKCIHSFNLHNKTL